MAGPGPSSAFSAGKARAIEAFLAAHATTLTLYVGGHTAVPATALMPLDKLFVPPALDGQDGFVQPMAAWMTSCSRLCVMCSGMTTRHQTGGLKPRSAIRS